MDGFSVAAEKKLEALGKMPDAPKSVRQQARREAQTQVYNDVFGIGHKTDKHGKPIEAGVGSAGNQTRESVAAYIASQSRRDGGPEPGYEQHLAKMQQQLADSEARRRAGRKANDDEDDEI